MTGQLLLATRFGLPVGPRTIVDDVDRLRSSHPRERFVAPDFWLSFAMEPRAIVWQITSLY
jgi:hypothetical protein